MSLLRRNVKSIQGCIHVPAVEARVSFLGVFVRDARLVERLMRGVLELAGARDALQDVLVRDDAVPNQLDRRAGEVSQVVVQNGLFLAVASAGRTRNARELQPAHAIVRTSHRTVTVLDCGRIESAGECPLTRRRQVHILKDDDAMFVEELLDPALRKRARGFGVRPFSGECRCGRTDAHLKLLRRHVVDVAHTGHDDAELLVT